LPSNTPAGRFDRPPGSEVVMVTPIRARFRVALPVAALALAARGAGALVVSRSRNSQPPLTMASTVNPRNTAGPVVLRPEVVTVGVLPPGRAAGRALVVPVRNVDEAGRVVLATTGHLEVRAEAP
jgi:hypothetical protein